MVHLVYFFKQVFYNFFQLKPRLCCRLCTNTEISKQIVELQGVNQLVRLCKEERERNFNDDVLVACLVSISEKMHRTN